MHETVRRNPGEDIAQSVGIPLPELLRRWPLSEPYNIRRHLFFVSSDGHTYPAFIVTPDSYRRVIGAYVLWYKIPRAAMKDFWLDFIDALLLCHEFEEKAPVDFRAWAYGVTVRYILSERKEQLERAARNAQTQPYDPMTNFAL
jgi:hypothetical protein